jgi:hypothetical protein
VINNEEGSNLVSIEYLCRISYKKLQKISTVISGLLFAMKNPTKRVVVGICTGPLVDLYF